MPKAPSAPPPPAPVIMPAAPRIESVTAPRQTQKGPAVPRDTLFARRGKRGMVIQMGAETGTNIPGTGS